MFCSQCGATNADNAVICVQCGRQLSASTPVRPSAVYAPGAPTNAVVPNHLVFAILVTVLCCLPSGIAAIVYAGQVNAKLQGGDVAGAQLASKNAKMWCWISVGAGVAVMLIYCMVAIFSFMTHRR